MGREEAHLREQPSGSADREERPAEQSEHQRCGRGVRRGLLGRPGHRGDQHGQGDGEAAWQPSLLALLLWLQIAEHGRDEFRDGWVNMHGTLNDRVGGISIHHVEHGMDDLIVAVDNM